MDEEWSLIQPPKQNQKKIICIYNPIVSRTEYLVTYRCVMYVSYYALVEIFEKTNLKTQTKQFDRTKTLKTFAFYLVF